MNNMEQAGDKECAQAVKELARWFSSASSKNEAAAECYNRAANKYRMAKKYVKCGNALSKAAECNMKAGSAFECATNHREAAKAYKLEDSHLAKQSYNTAIMMFAEAGKCRQAAKLEIEVAQMFDQEGGPAARKEAKGHYAAAAEYFMQVDAPASATAPQEKVAEYTVMEKDFKEAAKLWEELGHKAMGKSATSFKAKVYFFNATLAMLATTDSISAAMKQQEYVAADHRFERSDECKLLTGLIEAFDGVNVEQFATLLSMRNEMKRFEDFQITMLMAARTFIDNAPGGAAPAPAPAPAPAMAAFAAAPAPQPSADAAAMSAFGGPAAPPQVPAAAPALSMGGGDGEESDDYGDLG